MRKIINPYIDDNNGKCFGCSPHNSMGLRMNFVEDGEYIIAEWEPQAHLSGFKNVLHGGIQATIMDEIASWVVFVKCQTSGLTTELNAKYRRPVLTDQGKITVRAKLISKERKFAKIHTEIFDHNGKLGSQADVTYMIFPQDIAKEKFNYPGIEAFFESK
ncbi:PaaI family thioesterase [Ancylomarina sp. 16SWW S1-10-2]|uniref:PaaI family thioesterase n=1 Tax=Ancylomarina sp. 16SWW S1-10-2 TaxID=2499681 RepID=UPI0012ADAED4|nr:PaaI family thioesterase [Ancylomarina sp. 16SWW S1-10-2]MRT91591.1 PaaI family thioesterase [Ancylomarina sp. 16SWW S1-10-2]